MIFFLQSFYSIPRISFIILANEKNIHGKGMKMLDVQAGKRKKDSL